MDNLDTLPMGDAEADRLAQLEAFDSPQEYQTTDMNGNVVTCVMYPLPDWPIYVREGEVFASAKVALKRGYPPVIFLPSAKPSHVTCLHMYAFHKFTSCYNVCMLFLLRLGNRFLDL